MAEAILRWCRKLLCLFFEKKSQSFYGRVAHKIFVVIRVFFIILLSPSMYFAANHLSTAAIVLL